MRRYRIFAAVCILAFLAWSAYRMDAVLGLGLFSEPECYGAENYADCKLLVDAADRLTKQ